MSAARKSKLGLPVWFAMAMGLAAVAGFLCGFLRVAISPDLRLRVISMPSHRDRPPVAASSARTSIEFVRAVLKGSIDDRRKWREIRGFSEDEVKSALAEIESDRLDFNSSTDLQELLFYRWGEINPIAANAMAKELFPRQFDSCRQAVITAWIKQGGMVDAWNAVREEGEVWACTRSVPGEVSEMLVASLSDLDDEAAFKEVLRLNDENCNVADDLCHARAGGAVATPESRAAFLAAAALHSKHYVLNCARDALFKEWEKNDATAARAWRESLPPDEEDE